MKAKGIEKRGCPLCGFELKNIQNLVTFIYPNIVDFEGLKFVKFHLISFVGAVIKVRSGNAEGIILRKVIVKPTGGNNKYVYVICELKDTKGLEGICFCFDGNRDDLMYIDFLR